MRIFRGALLALTLISGSAHGNPRECLHNATSSELLREIERRLSGSDPVPGREAVASFSCSQWGDLSISLIGGPQAIETTKVVSLRDPSRCSEYAQGLRQTHSQITGLKLLGVCDSWWDLQRFSMNGDGALQRLQARTLRDPEQCQAEARAINGGAI